MTAQQLDEDERTRRLEDVDRLRHSTMLEGGVISAAAEADQDAFAAGELDEAELLSRFRRRYGLAEPSQDERIEPPVARQSWETSGDHPWWPGYLDTKWWRLGLGESVLRNTVAATTADELRVREGDAAAVRGLTLRLHEVPASYDLTGLTAIHRHLFQDVYPWAGRIRTTNAAQGPPFATPTQIENLMGQVAAHIAGTDLAGLGDEDYADNLARVYHIINVCRPFHAGSGRAQREFVTALAHDTGRTLDWAGVDRNRHDFASLRARRDRDLAPLIGMFGKIITRTPAT